MTTVLKDAWVLATTPDFEQRVAIALVLAASNVMTETATTLNHAARVTYAKTVLHQPEIEGMNAALAVAAQPGITTTPTDADIQFTINSLFNALAGVST